MESNRELAINRWILSKFDNRFPFWTLYRCPEHGPFAHSQDSNTGVCPMCKVKAPQVFSTQFINVESL